MANSGTFDGLTNTAAKEKIADHVEQKKLGKRTVNWRLRDWGISRQRYWGTPIPIIYCDKCGTVPVPEKDLPVRLPVDVEFTGKGRSPLAESRLVPRNDLPEVRRQGTARDGHHGHLRGLVVVFPALLLARKRTRRPLTRKRPATG